MGWSGEVVRELRLRRRSPAMRWARSWARVRPRMGIMVVLSVQWFGGGVVCSGSSPVGAHKLGNSRALPGVVTWVRSAGEVKINVPSGNCCSRQPQKVLTKW